MQTIQFNLSITAAVIIAIAVLALLIFCILLARTSSRRGKAQNLPEEKKTQNSKAEDDATLQVVLGTAVALAMEQSAQEQLIAVLTAAVSAMWDGDGTFVVRRVRRIQTSPAWQRAGREEQIYSRM